MIFPDMEIPHRLQVTMQIPSKLSFHLKKTGTYKKGSNSTKAIRVKVIFI